LKRQIAFVFGGPSVEHEISIITGIQALLSFDNEKYEPFALYIAKDGSMFVGDALNDIENFRDLENVKKNATQVILVRDGNRSKLVGYPKSLFSKTFEKDIDLAFLCVHGTNVEDGALQGFFKTLGVPIVGCDVTSAALGMDKFKQKSILKDAGVNVLDAIELNYADYENITSAIEKVEERFSYPIIVKPVNLGSSVGISVASNKDEFEHSLDEAFSYANRVLVERAIENLSELNCSILGDNEEAEASVIERPISSDEILSYEDKYLRGGKKKTGASASGMASVSREIPAKIDESTRENVERQALLAFKTLGCSGVSRVDFLVDEDTGEVYFNEINTIPGSLSFYLWEPKGVSYKELLNRCVEIANKNERRQRSITFSFDTNVLNTASLAGAKGK
jgi:D-alanine-D-alanine ligase